MKDLETKYGESNTQSERTFAIQTYINYMDKGIIPTIANGEIESISFPPGELKFYYADGKYITGMDGLNTDNVKLNRK